LRNPHSPAHSARKSSKNPIISARRSSNDNLKSNWATHTRTADDGIHFASVTTSTGFASGFDVHLGVKRMFGAGVEIKEAWVVLPILALLLVGGAIALQSGVRRPASSRDIRQMTVNLSRMVLRLLGYVAVLITLQGWIGLGHSMGW
jgi:hypothetical protein